MASITRLISKAEIHRRLKRWGRLKTGLAVEALPAAQLIARRVAARRGRGAARVSALFGHAERHATARVVPGLRVLGVRVGGERELVSARGYHAVLEVERPRHARGLACGTSVEPAD